MSVYEDEKVEGWFPGRRVEARIVFITTDEMDYSIFETWRERAKAFESAELNRFDAKPVEQWGSRRKPFRYVEVDMHVTPSDAAVLGWTFDIVTESASWFAGVLAATLATWPNLTYQRAELEIR